MLFARLDRDGDGAFGAADVRSELHRKFRALPEDVVQEVAAAAVASSASSLCLSSLARSAPAVHPSVVDLSEAPLSAHSMTVARRRRRRRARHRLLAALTRLFTCAIRRPTPATTAGVSSVTAVQSLAAVSRLFS